MGQACCTSFAIGPNDVVIPVIPRGACGCGTPSFEISHVSSEQRLLSRVSSEEIIETFTSVNQGLKKHYRNPYVTLCPGYLLGLITFFVLVSNSLWRPIIWPNLYSVDVIDPACGKASNSDRYRGSESCQCGTMECTKSTGFFCSTNTCHKFPLCSNTKGRNVNTNDCQCGTSSECTSKTGLFCLSNNTCSTNKVSRADTVNNPAPSSLLECENTNGNTINTATCRCHNLVCTDETGLFCKNTQHKVDIPGKKHVSCQKIPSVDENSFIWMILTSTAVAIQFICWIPFSVCWCKNRSAVKRVVEDTFSDWIDRGIVTNVLWFGGSSGSKHRPAQPAMVILYISPNNIELANSATTNVVRSAIVVPAVKEDEPKVKLKKLQEMFQEQLITAEDYEIKKQEILDSM